jgi:hypothetical protein
MSTHSKLEVSPTPSVLPPKLETDQKTSDDQNVVEFSGPDDPDNALNWPLRRKVIVTMLYSFCTMGATWASTASVFS